MSKKSIEGSKKEVNNKIVVSNGTKLKQVIQNENIETIREDKIIAFYSSKTFKDIITGPKAQPILRSLREMNFSRPSTIQEKSITILNDEKKDLIAQSQNGTGKTVAFIVPMLLHVNPQIQSPQIICICPTRELVMQNYDVFSKLNSHLNFTSGICLKDHDHPSKNTQILFGTAASIVFQINSKIITDLSKINFIVFDEADAILSKSSAHIKHVNALIEKVPNDVQYAYFSATFMNASLELIKKTSPNAISIRLKQKEECPPSIQHWYTVVTDKSEGMNVVVELVKNVRRGKTLIFIRNKKKIDFLCDFLKANKIQCEKFSSELSKDECENAFSAFKSNKVNVLVTTDMLSRGIDIPNISIVINFQVPTKPTISFSKQAKGKGKKKNDKKNLPDIDTYLHRAGRVGRFGRFGICFTVAIDNQNEPEREDVVLKRFCNNFHLDVPLHFVEKEDVFGLSEKSIENDDAQINDEVVSIESDEFEYDDDDEEIVVNNENDDDDDDDDDYDDNFD